jgi:hypothetical protein
MNKTQAEVNSILKFTKLCLKDEGYSKELIAYLLSTYDLASFIGTHTGNKLAIATGFLNHARKIEEVQI